MFQTWGVSYLSDIMKSIVKGMTFGWGSTRSELKEPYAMDSLKKLIETGTEWIALSFWTWQDSVKSTKIYYDYGYTNTDNSIEKLIDLAHDFGLKVCLKPVVNSRDGFWRGLIRFPDHSGETNYWKEWFSSYTSFMEHYASLGERKNVDMFCTGCEMTGTEHRVEEWRSLNEKIRKLVSSPLVYNANHGSEENVPFFDELDFIGTSAYYPVAHKANSKASEMIEYWKPVKERLKTLSSKFGKKILFMEIGCRSAKGCAIMPWDFEHKDYPVSENEQSEYYEAALSSLWEENWFKGFFWWDWSHHLYDIVDAHSDTSFNIYGKKAEKVLRKWYKT